MHSPVHVLPKSDNVSRNVCAWHLVFAIESARERRGTREALLVRTKAKPACRASRKGDLTKSLGSPIIAYVILTSSRPRSPPT